MHADLRSNAAARAARRRRAQAMIEFAICLLAFSLVLSALLAFGAIIPKRMALQCEARREAGCVAQNGRGSPEGSLAPRHLDNLPPDVRPVAVVETIASERHKTVDIDATAAKYFFGKEDDKEFRIHERVSMPSMRIPSFEITDRTPGGGQ